MISVKFDLTCYHLPSRAALVVSFYSDVETLIISRGQWEEIGEPMTVTVMVKGKGKKVST